MTKDLLQKQLLKIIQLGVKPSDLKKGPKLNKIPVSPPSMSIGNEQPPKPFKKPLPTPLKTEPKKDEDYSSSEEEKPILDPNPIVSKNPNKTLSSSYVLDLEKQNQALQKQLQVYKDFKQADLKIKEKQKQEITELKEENHQLHQDLNNSLDLLAEQKQEIEELSKSIEGLKKQAKTPLENPVESKQEIKTFLCSDCNQTKPQTELSRVFGKFSFCLACSKKARQAAHQEKQPNPQPSEFICYNCSQLKQETPNKMKLNSTLQLYSVCSPCRPLLKEFNEADLITDELWAKYPYSSASEILEKEFNIKKEEPW